MHMSDEGHCIRIMSYNILADLLVCCRVQSTIDTTTFFPSKLGDADEAAHNLTGG